MLRISQCPLVGNRARCATGRAARQGARLTIRPDPGETITHAFAVTNRRQDGSSTDLDTTASVTVSDTIPAGTTFVPRLQPRLHGERADRHLHRARPAPLRPHRRPPARNPAPSHLRHGRRQA
ncbi:DUF11 domain-containing protein [Kitasatospora sp. NPDC091335]|uniref:DUF11 domain-containing protein n=1 Tax=Kitasatospora sp. NPDC091335 TaxID=3364085 RepID=UPI003805C762